MTGLPKGWVEARIGEIADTQLGKMLSQKARSEQNPKPYLRNRNVQWARFDLAEVVEMDFVGADLERFRLRAGDLIVCEGGEVGRAAVWNDEIKECYFQKALHRIRPLGGIGSKYLMYLCRHYADRGAFARVTTGSTIAHLPQEDLREIVIPLPPLAEQQRIVAAIEEQFSRLDVAEASLRSARRRLAQLRTSAMADVLSGDWPLTTLGELAEVITKGTTPTSVGHRFVDEGVLFVKAESLVSGLINHERCAHIGHDADEALSRSRLREHDVLVTIAGTLGRVGIVRERDLPANTNQAVSLVRLRDPRLEPYIAHWLRSERAQRHFGVAARGVGLQNLNLQQVRSTPIAVPPIDIQQQVVAEIDKRLSLIDAMSVEVATSVRRSSSLRQSILREAFAGRLVPPDPADEPTSVLLERIRADRACAPGRRRRSSPV